MEQGLRAFDTQILEVGKRRFAEHRFAAALQGACARRQRIGGVLQREPLLEVVVRPPPEAQNARVSLPDDIASRSAEPIYHRLVEQYHRAASASIGD